MDRGDERGKFKGREDGREPRPPDPPPVGVASGGSLTAGRQSYAAAISQNRAALFPSIALPRRQPFNKEGKPAIIFTPAEIGACTKQMDFALIAKFSSGRPHVSAVEKEFRTSWKVEGQMTVSDLDGRHILVILTSEQDVTSALTQAPRRVGTSLFRLFRWTPDFHFRKESTIITIWIRFPRLRPDLFNEGVLKCLCQPFGRFLDSDNHTKQRTRCAFARCCVEVDIAKPLPHEIWIDIGDGHGWWQEIIYEGNLKYCSKCRLHGHNLSECRKMRLAPQNRVENQRDPVQEGVADRAIQQNKQEWTQVQRKKVNGDREKQALTQADPVNLSDNEGDLISSSGIVLKEREFTENSNPNPVMDTRKTHLSKSNSDTNLAAKALDKSKEFLTRSNSMNDISKNCSVRRLEYIQEEFNHFHLIHKHLQKTKEETLARLNLMKQRKEQNINVQGEVQHDTMVSGQEDTEFVVPETQLGSIQPRQEQDKGHIQKKKTFISSASKPLTRAAKKQKSPKKK